MQEVVGDKSVEQRGEGLRLAGDLPSIGQDGGKSVEQRGKSLRLAW